MNRNRWASLALATCLLWGSGCCCCNWFESGWRGNFGRAAGYAPTPCECPPGLHGATLAGGPSVHGGHIINGPMLYAPDGTPMTPGQPPRIIPVPQAHAIPYTP